MKKILIIFPVIIIVLFCCEKDSIEYDCEAIVLENISNGVIMCNKDVYDLKFIKGLDKVNSFVDSNFNIQDSVYAVLNLPDDLQVENLRIRLNIREVRSGEGPTCYNFEMPVLMGPIVYITQAEK